MGGGKGVCIGGGGSASRRGLNPEGWGWADPPSDTTGYGQHAGGTHPTGMHSCFYHLQRSWGKVMFLHVSVILFTGGGVSASVHVGIHTPPRNRPPPGADPPEQCMLGDTGNKRAVRILLQCILVFFSIFSSARYLYLPVYICWPRRLEIGTLTVRRRIALRSRCSDEVCNE